MTKDLHPTDTLDCIGLFCPEPLFQTRQKMDSLSIGDILEVLADDPASEEDIARYCKRTGQELVSLNKDDEDLQFFIKKLN
ncbi:MAG: sulfurtransferase TusA family protein [Promethearchaeota archaeon]